MLTNCKNGGGALNKRHSKTKGFTLIELLAVIVILAVIALIATPIIMGVINDSKKGAAKDSMYSYVKAVELDATRKLTPDTDLLSGTYTTKDGNLMSGTTKVLDVNMKGTKPSENFGSITLSNGKVILASLMFDGYKINYDGQEATILDKDKYAIGEVVYFDPTGVVTNCTSGKEWTPTNTGTTCYKWNVIKAGGNNVEMLLDHNLGNKVAWVSKTDYLAAGGTEAEFGTNGNNKYGPITTIKQLKTDTTNWTKAETLTTSDNVTRDANGGSKYIINYNGMKARMISGQKVATIGKDTVWTPSKYTGKKYTESSWLYQNLSSSNTVTQPYGYWTDTAYPSTVSNAWRANYSGSLDSGSVYNASGCSVRPVVRVLKSNI